MVDTTLWSISDAVIDYYDPVTGDIVELYGKASHPGVPEPTTLLLLGCGLVGMAAYGWRRKKKQS
jgi:threonine dehydrogenase-like Zn-dependent dehydrogenase